MQVTVSSVDYRGVVSVDALVAPASPSDVFTPAERVHCEAGRGLDRWAGRLAAKRAVALLLGVDAADVEVLPGEHPPHLPVSGWCRLGHPPQAVLRAGGPTPSVTLSISHDHGLAAAVAARR